MSSTQSYQSKYLQAKSKYESLKKLKQQRGGQFSKKKGHYLFIVRGDDNIKMADELFKDGKGITYKDIEAATFPIFEYRQKENYIKLVKQSYLPQVITSMKLLGKNGDGGKYFVDERYIVRDFSEQEDVSRLINALLDKGEGSKYKVYYYELPVDIGMFNWNPVWTRRKVFELSTVITS